MAKYRVVTHMTTRFYIDVDAESTDDAFEKGRKIAIDGSFIEDVDMSTASFELVAAYKDEKEINLIMDEESTCH